MLWSGARQNKRQTKVTATTTHTYQKLGAVFNQDFIWVVDHFAGEFDHFGCKRGAKEEALTLLGHLLLDQERVGPMAILLHHVIRLVQNKDLDRLGIDVLTLEPVDDLSRCTDDQVGVELFPLFGENPRQRQLDFETRHVRPHGPNGLVDNLNGKLSRWRDAERLYRRGIVDLDAKQHADGEGGGLSRTGLRLSNQIPGRIR
jgi:hypothetical protein